MKKSISISVITESGLANLNGGETSGSLKTLSDGRVYASGQSLKRAIMNTIGDNYPEKFLSTAEVASQDIKNDWFADINGYLIASSQERRYSPLQVSSMVQIGNDEIVNDMLLRLSNVKKEKKAEAILKAEENFKRSEKELEEVISKSKEEVDISTLKMLVNEYYKTEEIATKPNEKCDELKLNDKYRELNENIQKALLKYARDYYIYRDKREKESPYDNRIANIEMIDTLYKYSVHIDTEAIGSVENFDNKAGEPMRVLNQIITNDEKKLRVKAIIGAIAGLRGFAKQARASADVSPDFVIISSSNVYSHKIQKALKLTEDRKLDENNFKMVIEELEKLSLLNGKDKPNIYIGDNKILNNSNEIEAICKSKNIFYGSSLDAFLELSKEL